MNNNDNDIFNGWVDEDPTELEVMDRWFESDVWKSIVHHADNDCEDSLEVMEKVNEYLGNLCFHISHHSSRSRINYEIKQFESYINQFTK